MGKQYVPVRMDAEALGIVDNYKQEKGLDSRSEAVRSIIKEYPLLRTKQQTKALAQQIKRIHCRAVGKEIDMPSQLTCLECRVPPERCDIKKKLLES